MTIKIGFVGAGFVAQVAHIPAFSKSRHFECVAIADPRSDIRESVATRYGIKLQFDNHLELLHRGQVDAVIVTLPRRLTARVVEDCLEAGLWVFAEKPLILNSGSAARILAKVGSRGVCVGLMKRCDAGVRYTLEFLEKNKEALGSLESVAAECHAGDSYCGIGGDIKSLQERVVLSDLEDLPTSVTPDMHHAYEQFLNVYSHTLNLSEFLTGLPVTIETGKHGPTGAGHLIGHLGSVPYALSVSRGVEHPWVESILLRYKNAIITVKLPAAFDKTGIGMVEVCTPPNLVFEWPAPATRRWAFDSQPDRFHALIGGVHSPIDDILSAWRYAENAERIFAAGLNT